MSSANKSGALARCTRFAIIGWMAAIGQHCDYTAYSSEPTFCDRWCRVLLRPNCEQEPENCVRTCERSTGPSDCQSLYERLLQCYEATPTSDFACSSGGFQRHARPEEEVCQPERDALLRCAYPQVPQCLEICRAVEAVYAADAPMDAGADAGNASQRTCPSYDVPCDSICWIVYFEIGSLEDLSTDASTPDLDASTLELDAGTSTDASSIAVPAGADDLVACALQRARACRENTASGADAAVDGGSDLGANWSSVLSDCVRELRR